MILFIATTQDQENEWFDKICRKYSFLWFGYKLINFIYFHGPFWLYQNKTVHRNLQSVNVRYLFRQDPSEN